VLAVPRSMPMSRESWKRLKNTERPPSGANHRWDASMEHPGERVELSL
jgi:hypothetical protein